LTSLPTYLEVSFTRNPALQTVTVVTAQSDKPGAVPAREDVTCRAHGRLAKAARRANYNACMSPEEILAVNEHRPWPLPRQPWIMRQQWNRLLFAHWAIDPAKLRPLVPAMLSLDIRDGRCWVAVTPFYLSGLQPRSLPAIPGMSSFPELNVRTYVTLDGKPGVFFFSLDAGAVSAVMGARLFYALPYFYAHMRVRYAADAVHYKCNRRHMGKIAEFDGDYAPVGPASNPSPGSLEQFLTERYCLYAVEAGRLYRAEIHHVPWPLQIAKARIATNTMAQAAGIDLPNDPPLLHFARQLEVLVWTPERLL